jgi:hypothetical protein
MATIHVLNIMTHKRKQKVLQPKVQQPNVENQTSENTSSPENEEILRLQNTIGNSGVQSLVKQGKIRSVSGESGFIQQKSDYVQRNLVEELDEAMDGWGTDEDAIFAAISKATPEEKRAVLNDPRMVQRLSSELDRGDMLRALNGLNAPLRQRLNVAMDGWGADSQTILTLTQNATEAEKREILDDTALVRRLGGELSREDMLTVVSNINAPLSLRLNTAMDGWGADSQTILTLVQNATEAEKREILEDTTLVQRLASELSREDMLTVLSNINAPLILRLNKAMDGWGADSQTILTLTRNVTEAEKREVMADTVLVQRLASELSREDMGQTLTNLLVALNQSITIALDLWGGDAIESILLMTATAVEAQKTEVATNQTLMQRLFNELSQADMQRVIEGLGALGAEIFENSTDTGNEYRSLATLFPSGLTVAKNVNFIEDGTFGPGGFDTLKARVIASVSSYMSNKYKVKIEPGSGAEASDNDGEYPITVVINDDSSAEYPMHLHGGAHGRSGVNENEGNIYELGQATETSIPDITLAHEAAHMILGVSDEYENASIPGRVITDDHSLMGNFYAQGIAEAEIKIRHFEFLVTLINGWFPDRNVSIEQI